MGAYQVGKFFFEVGRDYRAIERFWADPEPILERYHLTAEEKAAIRNKDVRYLYELGVNPYQIIALGRFFGLPQQEVLSAIADSGASPAYGDVVTYPGPPRNDEYLIRLR